MQQVNNDYGIDQLIEAMPNLCLYSEITPSSPNDFGTTRQAITGALRRTKALMELIPEGSGPRAMAIKQGIQELVRDLNTIHIKSFKLEGKLDEARMANRLCLLHPGLIPCKMSVVGDQNAAVSTTNTPTTTPTQDGSAPAIPTEAPQTEPRPVEDASEHPQSPTSTQEGSESEAGTPANARKGTDEEHSSSTTSTPSDTSATSNDTVTSSGVSSMATPLANDPQTKNSISREVYHFYLPNALGRRKVSEGAMERAARKMAYFRANHKIRDDGRTSDWLCEIGAKNLSFLHGHIYIGKSQFRLRAKHEETASSNYAVARTNKCQRCGSHAHYVRDCPKPRGNRKRSKNAGETTRHWRWWLPRT